MWVEGAPMNPLISKILTLLLKRCWKSSVLQNGSCGYHIYWKSNSNFHWSPTVYNDMMYFDSSINDLKFCWRPSKCSNITGPPSTFKVISTHSFFNSLLHRREMLYQVDWIFRGLFYWSVYVLLTRWCHRTCIGPIVWHVARQDINNISNLSDILSTLSRSPIIIDLFFESHKLQTQQQF